MMQVFQVSQDSDATTDFIRTLQLTTNTPTHGHLDGPWHCHLLNSLTQDKINMCCYLNYYDFFFFLNESFYRLEQEHRNKAQNRGCGNTRCCHCLSPRTFEQLGLSPVIGRACLPLSPLQDGKKWKPTQIPEFLYIQKQQNRLKWFQENRPADKNHICDFYVRHC